MRLNAREKHALFAGTDLPTATHRSLLFATRLLSAVLAESGGRLEPGNSKGLSLRAVLAASGAPVPKSKVDQGTDTRRNPSARQPMTILVADDESNVRRVLELTLTRRGHKVLQASDGSGAIKIFRKDHESIDLVLSDLSMPGLSGIETLRGLQEIYAKVPRCHEWLGERERPHRGSGALRQRRPLQALQYDHSPFGARASVPGTQSPEGRRPKIT